MGGGAAFDAKLEGEATEQLLGGKINSDLLVSLGYWEQLNLIWISVLTKNYIRIKIDLYSSLYLVCLLRVKIMLLYGGYTKLDV